MAPDVIRQDRKSAAEDGTNYPTMHPCPHFNVTETRFRLPVLLLSLSGLLAVPSPLFAGNGKGEPGNEEPPSDGPPYVLPFVEYHVTWFQAEGWELQDVNRDGIAVGWSEYTNVAGEFRYAGFIVDHLGNDWDVEALFGNAIAALAPASGPWESTAFAEINAQGQILGFLFHAGGSLNSMIALFDIHTGSMTPVDYLEGDISYGQWDMNEWGDVFCAVRDGTQPESQFIGHLYHSPYPSQPECTSRRRDP